MLEITIIEDNVYIVEIIAPRMNGDDFDHNDDISGAFWCVLDLREEKT